VKLTIRTIKKPFPSFLTNNGRKSSSSNRQINITLIFILLLLVMKTSVADDLMVRNPFQAKANIQSTHFAYWYNDADPEVDVEKLQKHLDIIEIARTNLIDVQGYKNPISEYKMNIYMEDAGGSVPSGEIASVFVEFDVDGYMFIHMSKKKLKDTDQLIKALLAHEFFHTIQFSYYEPGQMNSAPFDYYWFQEGSASWASYAAWDDIELLKFWGVWALHLRPELYLTYSNYDDYSGSSAQRMYATSFFLWWITEYYADGELIKHILQNFENSKLQEEAYSSPLSVLSHVVSKNYGHNLEEIFADFAAHNVLLDYPKRQEFLQWLADSDIKLSDNLSMTHQATMSSWQDINHHNWHGERGPAQNWSSSYIKLNTSEIEEFELNFKGLTKGSLSSNARWHLTLVKSTGDEIEYQPIDLDDDYSVTAMLIDTRDIDSIYLSASAFSDANQSSEQFDFAYQFAAKGSSTEYQEVDWTPLIDIEVTPERSSGGGIIIWLLSLLTLINLKRLLNKNLAGTKQ